MTELIVFEGIDGSGKSTQARLFTERLEHLGLDVKLQGEPGGTDVGERIRNILLNPETDIEPYAELQCMVAARAQLYHKISTSEKDVYVTDRGPLSTWSYQVHGHYNGDKKVIEDFQKVHDVLDVKPSMNYIIDISLETKQERLPDDEDRIEQRKRDYYERVINGYHNPPQGYQYRCINGEQSIDAVAQDVFKAFTANHL